MGSGLKSRNPVQAAVVWVKKQPPKVKAFLGVLAGILCLAVIRLVVRDHDNLFVVAEISHAVGIGFLIYKLMKVKTCAGEQDHPCFFYILSPFFHSVAALCVT